MRLYDVFNSSLAVNVGLSLSSMVPPWLGYSIARGVSDLVTLRRKSLMVKAVRSNQWVASGEKASSAELDIMVQKVFRSIGRSLYDFYHFFNHPKKVSAMVDLDPSFISCIQRARAGREGTIIVAPHISNFDLIIRSVVLRGLPVHILSYPRPKGGYKVQNELRSLPGMTITPLSIEAIAKATQTLRDKGTVLTGVDRPLLNDDAKYRPRFFGREAAMPVFHIRLALKMDVPIIIVGGCRKPDGRYFAWASDPIQLEHRKDLVEETVTNAETVLAGIADVIRKAPEQWAMLYPIWPDTLDKMPT